MADFKCIAQLINEILDPSDRTSLDKHLKTIESLAKKVLKEHTTLNVFSNSLGVQLSPLAAAVNRASFEVFQLLIKLGADPFYTPKPEVPSAMEILATEYFSQSPNVRKTDLFEWVMKNEESPVFTWAKLNSNKILFDAFNDAGLIPKANYINKLPIHVAIEAGRMDLVREVINAAGSIQKAGDICRMSILQPAIIAVLKDQKNALELLTYLITMGASTQTPDINNVPAIMQTITAHIYNSGIKEESVFDLVTFLVGIGVPLDVTNPYNGYTPILAAAASGYKKLFNFLLEKADAKTLNHRATMTPNYLLFQLFDKYNNKFSHLEILESIAQTQRKGYGI
jgi:ankyrin repeat protein